MEQLAALADRVAALEAQHSTTPAEPVPRQPADLPVVVALQERSGPPYERGDVGGAVLYAGSVRFTRAEYEWQVERPVPDLLDLDLVPLARVLSALASPARLLLLRALLQGPCSSHQLQEALGVTSPGQLYHHVKELLAVGIVEQPDRSVYRLAPRKIVPFLAILAATLDMEGHI